jgi:2-polyprenyl-3-methyl-5-hydroxy-6-metoxy-1,4-benzoquinol methylase
MCSSPILENSREYLIEETMFRIGQSFRYGECEQCGSLNLAEEVSSDTKLYPDNYYSFSVEPENAFESFAPRLLATAMAKSSLKGNRLLLRFVSRYAPIQQARTLASILLSISASNSGSVSKKILDVGTGSGVLPFVLGLANRSFTIGIDPFLATEKQTNSFELKRAAIQDIHETFDLILFNHSLEHMHNIANSLAHAKSVLEPSGTIIIRIPTVSSQAWDTYRENWFQLDAPRHTCVPSRKGLEKLATSCGLQIVKSYDDSTDTQFWLSEAVSSGLSPMDVNTGYTSYLTNTHTRKKKLAMRRAARKNNRTHRGDQTVLILRTE